MWATAASLNMEGNAEKWLQVYKRRCGLGNWEQFIAAVEQKFGAYDYQHAIDDLLELKQTGSVEDYVTAFEALQYQIMHDEGMGDTYFISQFIKGLKPDIRFSVQGQVPATMERAIMLAKIQQHMQEKCKGKSVRSFASTKYSTQGSVKSDTGKSTITTQLPKERQLRDYCRANNLCFYCREPCDPSHPAKCTKRPKSQMNVLAVNDLDTTLTEEIIEQLAIEDALTEEFGSLSLNALAGTETGDAMKLRALVQNKVMLMLVDSGSSHTFVSSNFLKKVGIIPLPAPAKVVKVANGDILVSDKYVPQLSWWLPGYTGCTDMRVLDLGAYNCVLGYDWLRQHSPIHHDWQNKTMQFEEKGTQIKIQGVLPSELALHEISIEKSIEVGDG